LKTFSATRQLFARCPSPAIPTGRRRSSLIDFTVDGRHCCSPAVENEPMDAEYEPTPLFIGTWNRLFIDLKATAK